MKDRQTKEMERKRKNAHILKLNYEQFSMIFDKCRIKQFLGCIARKC